MPSFEHRGVYNKRGVPSEPELAEATKEAGLHIKRWWHEFGFPGQPPQTGNIAENRLVGKCEQYAGFISNPRLKGATGSDGARRAAHNELSVMVFGKQLDVLDWETRDRLAEFACQIATGLSSEALGSLAEQHPDEE